jgi:hypothetical protein
MDRLADPRIYKCALEQSVEPSQYTLDSVKYNFCKDPKEVLLPETEAPITTLDKCYASRKQQNPEKN